jgi:uncharacterized protein involved in response to NO
MKTAPIYLNNSHVGSLRLSRVRNICRPIIRFASVALACLSILVMGSENIWFPWPNLAGAFVLAVIVCIFNRMKRKPEN